MYATSGPQAVRVVVPTAATARSRKRLAALRNRRQARRVDLKPVALDVLLM
jgi:hypothetical protein